MKKRFTALAVIALAASLLLTACAPTSAQIDAEETATPNATQTNAPPTESIAADSSVTPATASAEDLDSGWDRDAATKITLNGASASIDGAGANADGSVVTISAAGTYVVSGTLADGQIAVAATNADTVRLVLDGASVTNKRGAAIYASQCDKLIITLADGTENAVTDGGDGFAYADEAEQEPNAALFSKDDLTINGTGSLTVNAGFNNGIGTKDDLLIVSGSFNVTAANNGLRGNDSVTVLGGGFTIRADGDGIQSSNAEDAEKGVVELQGGTFTVTAANDGIQAANALVIFGGSFDITTGGGSANAPVREEDFGGGRG
ncbi:MAG: carbohydrate-binding domain-containing protein, partial [Oscillospiraceae bacterium]|nr:carbohydrate-binding domain-containing protein [Oscillospiraceae bacterium]